MKIINLEQGSKEWLKWRQSVITATDCSIITGTNPFKDRTLYKCWQRKLGLIPEQETNEAMDEGRRLEPEARDLFIQEKGIHMTPVVVESSEFEFLGASLDGISKCGKYLLEVKCGVSSYKHAVNGEIPAYYMDQMQHQLLVTGAEMCYYYCYRNNKGICMEVFPDPTFKERFLPKAREFWRLIALEEAPPMALTDYRDRSDDVSWNEYVAEYSIRDSKIKELSDEKEFFRKKLIEMCGNDSCRGSGLKVIRGILKGRIDYNEIPEIQGINLEKYRKESTVKWTLLIDKGEK